jgi:quercetin dioxygenase-like cupin family protein
VTRFAATRSPLLALALVAVFAGAAVATVATGFVATPLARGTVSKTVQLNTGVDYTKAIDALNTYISKLSAVEAPTPAQAKALKTYTDRLADLMARPQTAINLQTKGSIDVANATVIVAPAGDSGWHEHPGIVLVTVKSGTLTFYNKTCAGTVHAAGTTFIEVNGDGPGIARNESTTVPVELVVTYIVPTTVPPIALRNDVPVAPCVLP